MRRHEVIVKQVMQKLSEEGFNLRKDRIILARSASDPNVIFLDTMTHGKSRHLMKIDIIGFDTTIGRFASSIAIEVSLTSDVKREARRLIRTPARCKFIVTEDLEGSIQGIPMVPIKKLSRKYIESLKEVHHCMECNFFTYDLEELSKHRIEHDIFNE